MTAALTGLIGISLYGACYGLFLTLVPAFLITDKGFSQISINIIFSLFYIAVSISQLTAGPLSDRKGRRGLMVGGLMLVAVGLSAFSLFNNLFVYFFILLASLGMGVFSISSITYLNETAPADLKGTISGAYYLFWGVGFFGGPLVNSKLSSFFLINTCFVIMSGLAAIVAMMIFLTGSHRQ